jgi:hypothetical protein
MKKNAQTAVSLREECSEVYDGERCYDVFSTGL